MVGKFRNGQDDSWGSTSLSLVLFLESPALALSCLIGTICQVTCCLSPARASADLVQRELQQGSCIHLGHVCFHFVSMTLLVAGDSYRRPCYSEFNSVLYSTWSRLWNSVKHTAYRSIPSQLTKSQCPRACHWPCPS
jgi:hypothetical protein